MRSGLCALSGASIRGKLSDINDVHNDQIKSFVWQRNQYYITRPRVVLLGLSDCY